MSAGICIMNRNAIAMAADSAVTIGDHAAIHNSANKLFSLSRSAPVALIVYANASLMTVPVEIIVKQYKKQLQDKTFSRLAEYVDDFLNYIGNHSDLFRFSMNEENYIMDVFANLMSGLIGDYNKFSGDKISETGRILTQEEINDIGERTCQSTITFVRSFPKRTDYCFANDINSRYLSRFVDFVHGHSEFKWMSNEQIEMVCKTACEIYDTDFERNGYVGFAVAGYGNSEIYPHMTHLHVSGSINGKLRYRVVEEAEICEKTPASIAPLAQTDVMQTFLFGINDRFIEDLSQEIPKQINESISAIDDNCFADGKKADVQIQMNSVTGRILGHMREVATKDYMLPIIQSVASLPIEELALLAESMINITSLRRKVAIDRNIGTVGGPIDVAIISKGDGFIWLKRKHYFERKYNPQYFYSHFEMNERYDDCDDD